METMYKTRWRNPSPVLRHCGVPSLSCRLKRRLCLAAKQAKPSWTEAGHRVQIQALSSCSSDTGVPGLKEQAQPDVFQGCRVGGHIGGYAAINSAWGDGPIKDPLRLLQCRQWPLYRCRAEGWGSLAAWLPTRCAPALLPTGAPPSPVTTPRQATHQPSPWTSLHHLDAICSSEPDGASAAAKTVQWPSMHQLDDSMHIYPPRPSEGTLTITAFLKGPCLVPEGCGGRAQSRQLHCPARAAPGGLCTAVEGQHRHVTHHYRSHQHAPVVMGPLDLMLEPETGAEQHREGLHDDM